MPSSRSSVLLTAGTLLLGAVSLRFALRGTIQVLLLATEMTYFGGEAWSWVAAVGQASLGILGLAFAWFLASTRGLSGRGGWMLGGVGTIGLLVFAYWMQPTTILYTPPDPIRQAGHFPFEAGRVVRHERSGYAGEGHIGPDGFRLCAPTAQEQTGPTRVSLYGDSMVYGLALDDEDTICWRLREHFDDVAPGRITWSNRGQPGASVHSHADTLAWAEGVWPSDLAVVGIFMADDAQALDLNRLTVVQDSLVIHAASAVVGADVALSSLLAFAKVGRSELYEWISASQGLESLGAAYDAAGVPALWFMWDTPHRQHAESGWLAQHEALVIAAAERHPSVTYVGVVSEPVAEHGEVYRIPNDGHPTPDGVGVLLPRFIDLVQESGVLDDAR